MSRSYTDAPGITIDIGSNGHLALLADAQGVQWLKDNREDQTDFDVLSRVLEGTSCNGGYTLFDAGLGNPNVGLTDAPCIAESMDVGEDGQRSINGRFWYFNDYALRDMVETLIERGELTFHQGPDQEEVLAPRRMRP